MKLSGAEITIRLLENQGIDIIAGIPGGSNLPLYNALYNSNIRHVLARHEQGAGFIAQGMARSTGKAAVCFATSGPGVTNLLTAIADAKLDSVPMVAVTGQVPLAMIGTDAFQEVSTYSMTMHITKHNYLVKSASELLRIIPEAFETALGGRPGPVVVDIPKDIQIEKIEVAEWMEPDHEGIDKKIDSFRMHKIAELINESKRPLIYAGGGIISADAAELLYSLSEKNSIPVTCTLMGLGSFPLEDPRYIGMLGMHGARYTNHILDKTDLLITLGARFDDRAIGKAQEFCPHAEIIHIDIDSSEINKIKQARIPLVADIKQALSTLVPIIERNQRKEWLDEISGIKNSYPLTLPEKDDDLLNPVNLIRFIGSISGPDTIITTDVGQHQMWVAQHYPVRRPRTLLTSSGLGTMGFGLPVAIGAALANPEKRVICFSGDGSFQMNIQELATLADLQAEIKIIILNNGQLGLVRQQQELFYNANYIASRFDRPMDFASIGKQFGIKGINLQECERPLESIRELLDARGPCIIDVPVGSQENVYPMVPPGAANRDMIDGRLNGSANVKKNLTGKT